MNRLGFLIARTLRNDAALRTLSVPQADLLTAAAGKQVALTNLASVVFGFAMFAQALVIPQVIQIPEASGYGLGRSVLTAGLAMAPSGLVMMAFAPLSSRITMTWGPKFTLMAGAVVVGLGYVMGIFFMHSIWQIVLMTSIIGAGIGLAYAAMPALIMGAVPPEETGAANSFNTLMRSLGTSAASAVAGVILASVTMTLGPAVIPSWGAFQITMGAAAGSAAAALVVAMFLPRYRPGRAGTSQPPGAAESAADAAEGQSVRA